MDGALSFNETILNHLLVLKSDVWLLRSQIGHGRTVHLCFIYRDVLDILLIPDSLNQKVNILIYSIT